MTIEQAREVLVRASSSVRAIDRNEDLRASAKAAVQFVRHSSDRTFNDLELVGLVENMLSGKGAVWPESHEVTGIVLFGADVAGVEHMAEFVKDLTENGVRFKVEHEVTRFRVKVPKRRK